VSDSFLHKLFGRAGKATPSVEEARTDLDRLAAERPELQPIVAWLGDMLAELAPPEIPPMGLTLDPAVARARLGEGIPLLRGETLNLDPREFHRRWRRACEALEICQPDPAVATLASALQETGLKPGAMVEAVLAGRPESVMQLAEEHGLDPGLTSTVLRFTLFPTVTALANSLAPLREGAAWEEGYCPTCGSWPLLGEFRGLDQSRFLRCGLCASAWEVPRLWCPFCGNRNHERLGFFHQEGEEASYRVANCEECRGYVKMATVLSALPPLHLLVVDAVTLHLDFEAAQRGFTNPP
jgi:FdhE protein